MGQGRRLREQPCEAGPRLGRLGAWKSMVKWMVIPESWAFLECGRMLSPPIKRFGHLNLPEFLATWDLLTCSGPATLQVRCGMSWSNARCLVADDANNPHFFHIFSALRSEEICGLKWIFLFARYRFNNSGLSEVDGWPLRNSIWRCIQVNLEGNVGLLGFQHTRKCILGVGAWRETRLALVQ